MIFSAKKSAGRTNQFVDLLAKNTIAIFHALFVAQSLGASATQLSTYLLLGIDFTINMYFAGKIYWLHRKKHFVKCGETLQGLVTNEFLEFNVPFLFLVCFLAAYLGPNAEMIGIESRLTLQDKITFFPGNVRNEYFHFEIITDIDAFTETLLLLGGIDALSLIISSIFLKLT